MKHKQLAKLYIIVLNSTPLRNFKITSYQHRSNLIEYNFAQTSVCMTNVTTSHKRAIKYLKFIKQAQSISVTTSRCYGKNKNNKHDVEKGSGNKAHSVIIYIVIS